MNHSVKSKTIRHDCHLLVRAEPQHLQTLVFLLQLFKSNRRELEAIRGDELLPPPPAKIIAQNKLSRGSCPEGSGGDVLPSPPATLPGHGPSHPLCPTCFWPRSSLVPTSGNRACICTLNKRNKCCRACKRPPQNVRVQVNSPSYRRRTIKSQIY